MNEVNGLLVKRAKMVARISAMSEDEAEALRKEYREYRETLTSKGAFDVPLFSEWLDSRHPT